ncbi:MAG: hypothetical protein AB7V56_16590 [Candidatus Nitrosocosmicus sp.]
MIWSGQNKRIQEAGNKIHTGDKGATIQTLITGRYYKKDIIYIDHKFRIVKSTIKVF